MWTSLTEFVTQLLAPVLRLIAPLDAIWQGAVLAIPVAVLALLSYRLFSDQAAIVRTKDGIKANLLALRLFRDDLRVMLQAQGRLFLLIGRYLRLGLVPLAVLLVPVILLLSQIEARSAFRPIEVGTPALLTLTLEESITPSLMDARLEAPKGLRVETPAFRSDSERVIMWRIKPTESGRHVLTIRLGNEALRRQVWAGNTRPERLVPAIYRSNDVRSVGSPGEAAIDLNSSASKLSIEYEPLDNLFAGLSPASWSMFVSSLLFGFVLRRPMRVHF
jgi:hypothetical protein